MLQISQSKVPHHGILGMAQFSSRKYHINTRTIFPPYSLAIIGNNRHIIALHILQYLECIAAGVDKYCIIFWHKGCRIPSDNLAVQLHLVLHILRSHSWHSPSIITNKELLFLQILKISPNCNQGHPQFILFLNGLILFSWLLPSHLWICCVFKWSYSFFCLIVYLAMECSLHAPWWRIP